jgi:hypothetical protein
MSRSLDRGVATCLLPFCPERVLTSIIKYLGGRVSKGLSGIQKHCKIENGWQNSVKRNLSSGVPLGRQSLVP